jgi:hypothetical protein
VATLVTLHDSGCCCSMHRGKAHAVATGDTAAAAEEAYSAAFAAAMADTHLLEDEAAPGIPGVIEVEADSSGLQAFNRSRAATETMQQPDTISADRGLRYDALHTQRDGRTKAFRVPSPCVHPFSSSRTAVWPVTDS